MFSRVEHMILRNAAAQIARQRPVHLFSGGIGVFDVQCLQGHDDARRAVAALEGIIIHKQLLQGIQLAHFGIGQSLDGYNFAAVAIYRQQLGTATLSFSTVQQPQAPWLHARLVPVRPRRPARCDGK